MAKVALADLDRFEDFPQYAAACLKIKPKKGGRVPLLLNTAQKRVQRAIEDCLRNDKPPRIIELKARQTGLSTDAEARLFHMAHLRRGRNAAVFAHTRESASKIFDMARGFYDHLPDSARPGASYFTKNSIVFEHNESSMQVVVADARGGRGMTLNYVHISEFAFMREPRATLDAVLNAVPDQTDSLVIVESTAFGMNEFHDLWVNAKSGANDFVPVFIPWFDEPGYRRPCNFPESDLDEEEKELLGRYRLSMEQIAWRRWAIRNKAGGDVLKFRQENPATDTEAFVSSGSPIFSEAAIRWHNQHVPPGTPDMPIEISSLPPQRDIEWDVDRKAPLLTTPYAGGPLRIYEEPKPRHLYIAGVDPSEGDPGSDPSPIVVMNRMNLEVVAVWHGRRRPDLLAHTTRALAVYFNEAHVIWESNNHGLTFGIEFQKLYNDFYWREASKESVSKKITDKPGYNTNVKTKAFLWNALRTYVDDLMAPIRDPQIVSEFGSVFYEMAPGGQRLIKKYKDKTMDALVALALCLEAHMGAPDAELLPLTPEQYEELSSERRERYIADSMGGALGERPVFDRLNATANDLEELDEREYFLQRRAAELGFSEVT